MIDMLMEQATSVRNDWSSVCDGVVHDKPKFIKRTRDKMLLSNLDLITDILQAYSFTAQKFIEDDNSITLSLDCIDLVENGADEHEARLNMANSIMDYALEYYDNYALYSKSPNRKGHVPYILKALITDDIKKLGDLIQCRDGKN